MRSELIDKDEIDLQVVPDTRYAQPAQDIYRVDDETYSWINNQGFVTTTDISEYNNNPAALRQYDAGHIVVEPGKSFVLSVSEFTVESWIKLDDEPWVWSTLLSQRMDKTTDQSIDIQYKDNTMRVAFNNHQVVHDISTSTSISADQWHHVAVVRGQGAITVYVDGTPMDQVVQDSTNIQSSEQFIYIGAANDGGMEFPVTDPFVGKIQDFRITTQALYVSQFEPNTPLMSSDGGSLLGDPHIVTFGGIRYTL